jgi:hypothetical protein
MSREFSTINVPVNYGPRSTPEAVTNSVSTYGLTKQLEIYFDYADANSGIPATDAIDDRSVIAIPANSLLTKAYLHVTEAFTSTGSATLSIGTQTESGNAIASTGIDSIAVSNLTLNAWVVCDGSTVGATVGTVDAQVAIDDATAAFTAGKARLVLEYITPTV